MKKNQELSITSTKKEVKNFVTLDYNEYMNCINDSLIMLKLEQRIMKETGLRKYFRNYEYGKNEFVEEIEGAWKIYHRVFN